MITTDSLTLSSPPRNCNTRSNRI